MAKRPERLQILSELGKPQSLVAGEEQFKVAGSGPTTLVFGLGPEPEALAQLLPEEDVAFVECPEFARQMPPRWHEAVPASWNEVSAANVSDELLASSRVLLYAPNLRLFPSFWGPLWARRQWAALRDAPPVNEAEVWLSGAETDLLVAEIGQTLMDLGLSVRQFEPETLAADLPRRLRQSRPQIFFSINFKGLDPYGELFWLLHAAGVKVFVWCVDNPFHLLSALKGGWWRAARLAATDAWHAEALRQAGAGRVLHLPLAAWPHFARNVRPEPGLAGRVVYVGRSEFPDKAGFFAGAAVPDEALAEAGKRLELGLRPDFAWWRKRLEIESLWPGSAVRDVGFGAEQCTQALKVLTLQTAAESLPLTVYGDEGWRNLAPAVTDLRPPVDYYGPLAGVYAGALAVLNVTSLLLPAGLNQRHFDVWAAGGCLLTDATPGLALFPEELTREISFEHPGRLEGLVRRLEQKPDLRRDLVAAWRELILRQHTYSRRLEEALTWLSD